MNEIGEHVGLLLPVIFPMLAGAGVLLAKRLRDDRGKLVKAVILSLVAEAALICVSLAVGGSLAVWELTANFAIVFKVDGISRLFAALTGIAWLLVGAYAVCYMSHEREGHRFFGYYLIVLGVLVGLDFSGNLITLYLFYELMTLTSLPLVLHGRTKEAVMAGLKYLFYSVAGAFLALFGIFFLAAATGTALDFVPGGMFTGMAPNASAALSNGALVDVAFDGREGLLLAAVFCLLAGFGVKAGMFPLHGWLPTAHPVAPAPASALLSGVITKAGVLAIIRVVYFVVGPDVIRGTWVQDTWVLLTLLTVFMGSLLAFWEPLLKKRLAYSTVSQVSYILFGLSMLHLTSFVGALSHVVFHSLIKDGLFLCAGAITMVTGKTRVKDMVGLGRGMPLLLGCYTVLSLALIGIPPASGFVSKWYLATGAMASGTGAWAWIGPAVLLASALLTAGYLLPLSIQGYFPGADFGMVKGGDGQEAKSQKLSAWMMFPVLLFTAGALLLGCFPGRLVAMLETIGSAVL